MSSSYTLSFLAAWSVSEKKTSKPAVWFWICQSFLVFMSSLFYILGSYIIVYIQIHMFYVSGVVFFPLNYLLILLRSSNDFCFALYFLGANIATASFYLFVFHSFIPYLLSVYFMLCTYQRKTKSKKLSPWSHKTCILVVQDKHQLVKHVLNDVIINI